ncbi:nuclease-related domain-containing protein [Lysinibacillus sp. BW-2-10]|uniref:nuclease-related domain-containing protein n=1 Tax=Lysinibacillus sp. BW-2-10 TaxID=2590030 RepID=UPI0011802A07|nr:nuclease-related domain-containing protein [Lysinibacillus sp. BW-2-10]TSI06166.1 NERD domain-containing protein [Lysinibacillus sp. BW-2-10]
MWIFVFIILIGGCFAITLYIYDNSEFRKLTGYSFFSLFTDKKGRTAYKLVQSLHKSNGKNKVLLDISLPTTNHKIDAILVHQSGIYILNLQQFNGWIYGREQDEAWAEARHKNKLNKFTNPLIQNKLAILDLKELLSQPNSEHFHSIVVFSNDCSFRKVIIHSDNTDVLKMKELKSYWKHSTEVILSDDEISNIYNELKKYMKFNIANSKTVKSKVVPN